MSPAVETAYFGAGAALMGIGTIGFLYLRAANPENGAYHTVITLVALVATAAYAAMALRVGLVEFGDRSVYLARYVQWIVGTPLIVLYLGMLAGTDGNRLSALIIVDVLAMSAALGAALTVGTARWLMFGVGTVLYVVLLYGLLGTLGAAADGRNPAITALFEKLRNLTVVTWSFYPIVWLAGPLGFGVIDPFAEVLVVTYLDVVAKVGFGFIALNSKLALARMPDVDSLLAWRDALA